MKWAFRPGANSQKACQGMGLQLFHSELNALYNWIDGYLGNEPNVKFIDYENFLSVAKDNDVTTFSKHNFFCHYAKNYNSKLFYGNSGPLYVCVPTLSSVLEMFDALSEAK